MGFPINSWLIHYCSFYFNIQSAIRCLGNICKMVCRLAFNINLFWKKMIKLLLTQVFAKAGLDNVTSAMCKYRQQFGLDVQLSALVHNFNNIFSIGQLCRAGRAMNSLPSQILERYQQFNRYHLNNKMLIKYIEQCRPTIY